MSRHLAGGATGVAPMRATHEDENGSRPRGSGLVPLVRAVDSRLRGDDGWAASCRCLGSSFIAIARGLGGGHARTSMKVRYADLLGRDLPNTLGPGSPPSRGCGGGCLLVQAEDEWPPEPDVLLGSGRPFDCVRGATRTSSYSAQQLSFGVKRWQWLGPQWRRSRTMAFRMVSSLRIQAEGLPSLASPHYTIAGRRPSGPGYIGLPSGLPCTWQP